MISLEELSQVDWRSPWWGLLALQPFVMALLLKLRRIRVLHYAEAHLLPWAMRGNFGLKQHKWGKAANLMVWILLACAAAGPRVPLAIGNGQQKQDVRLHEMDIMVVMDVSPSMQARDVSPQRLQRAKLELQNWILRLQGERIGLIAFSGNAGLIMSLSRDYAAFNYFLQLADSTLFEKPGSAIATAVDLARQKLSIQRKPSSRAVLLLTDGETSSLSGPSGAAVWEAAKRLKSAGIPLYILGVGTQAGAPIPLADGGFIEQDGTQVVSRLDQAGFTELAKLANGKFALLEDGDGDWKTLYDNGLLTQPGSHPPADNVHLWRTLYPWFLFPALLLYLVLNFPIRSKNVKLATAALLFLTVSSLSDFSLSAAYAAESDWQNAYKAYHNRQYNQAQTLYGSLQGYSARMGEGAAAYRRKDYQYAVKQFSVALLEAKNARQRSGALFNLGNSYYLAGNYRASADAYLGVLRYFPGHRNAGTNHALAAAKLANQNKLDKFSAGILGRRGQQTGGDLGEDIDDRSVSMEPSAKEKGHILQPADSQVAGEEARLAQSGKQSSGGQAYTQTDSDRLYRAALKKLELVADKPAALHKELVKFEAKNQDEVPGDMPPW